METTAPLQHCGGLIPEEAALPGSMSPGADCQGAAASPRGAVQAECSGTANRRAIFL